MPFIIKMQIFSTTVNAIVIMCSIASIRVSVCRPMCLSVLSVLPLLKALTYKLQFWYAGISGSILCVKVIW